MVDQLSELYARHAPRRIVVLVPTRQVGRNLGRWLAAAGTDHANMVFETVAGVAESVTALDVTRAPIRRSDRDDRLLAAVRAIALVQSDSPFYFGDQTGLSFARAVERSISVLRETAVRPSSDGLAGQKLGTVSRLLAAFDDELTRRHLADDAALFEAARGIVTRRGTERTAGNVCCVLDEVALSAAAEQFLRAWAPNTRYRIGPDSYRTALPDRCAAQVLEDWPIVELPPATGVTRGGAAGVAAGAEVRVVKAFSPEREVEGVFADILERGLTWDQCELVYTRSEYLPLLESSAEVNAVPCTFGQGRIASGSVPGQALIGFYSWLANGLLVADLEHLLFARYLSFDTAGSTPVNSFDVAELLRAHGSGSGRDAYTRVVAEADSPKADDRVVAAARALSRWMQLVPTDTSASLAKYASAGLKLLADFVPLKTTRDRVAATSLVERLRRIEEADVTVPNGEASGLLLSFVEDHRYGTSVAEGGHLYVVPLQSAGYSGRAHTFVVGLDEHTFPGASNEDPILLDHERARLSREMPLVRGEPSRRIFALERALLATGDSVTLVGRGLDLIYGKHVEMTPVVETLRERLGVAAAQYPLVEHHSRALCDADALLSQRTTRDYAEAVTERYPWMAQGRYAIERRSDLSFNTFNGFLESPTPELSVRHGRVVSASKLETLAACPYRYFIRHVLKVAPLDDPDDVAGQWLNARELGSLLHDLYYRFMTRLQERSERVDPLVHEPELLSMLDELIEEAIQSRPPVGSASLENDKARLQRAALVFLRSEAASDAEPVAFELRFGRNDDSEPLAVALADDVVLTMSGSIDRVNRRGNEYEVWDYKTGTTRSFEKDDLRQTSEHLQWMLYAYAYEDLLARSGEDVSVGRSGYLFASDREYGRQVAETVPPRKVLADDLRPLFAMVEKGAFPHYQKSRASGYGDKPGGACKFCDFRELCATERRTVKDVDGLSVFDHQGDIGRDLVDWLSK